MTSDDVGTGDVVGFVDESTLEVVLMCTVVFVAVVGVISDISVIDSDVVSMVCDDTVD